MIEEAEKIFRELMESDEGDFILQKAMELAMAALRELKDPVRYAGIADSFGRKRVMALYSKMNENISAYLASRQAELDGEVRRLDGRLGEAGQKTRELEDEKSRLEQQISQMKTANQDLLLNELKLAKQEETMASCQAQQREWQAEEKRVLGEDGKALEHIRGRQKNCQRQINQTGEKVSYLRSVQGIVSQLFVRESGNQMVSNSTELSQQLERLGHPGQEGTDLGREARGILQAIQEDMAAYAKVGREEEEIRERYESYRESWGEESDIMRKLRELDMESEDKMQACVAAFQADIEEGLQDYDEVLGMAVARGEQERDAVERRQKP